MAKVLNRVDLSTGFSGLKDDPDHVPNDTLANIENVDLVM